jgi:hypothetical protein
MVDMWLEHGEARHGRRDGELHGNNPENLAQEAGPDGRLARLDGGAVCEVIHSVALEGS